MLGAALSVGTRGITRGGDGIVFEMRRIDSPECWMRILRYFTVACSEGALQSKHRSPRFLHALSRNELQQTSAAVQKK